MILIYTHKITPRIKYIFKHIFTLRLGVKIDFTSDIQFFKEYDSFKISYADQPIKDEKWIALVWTLILWTADIWFEKAECQNVAGPWKERSAHFEVGKWWPRKF